MASGWVQLVGGSSRRLEAGKERLECLPSSSPTIQTSPFGLQVGGGYVPLLNAPVAVGNPLLHRKLLPGSRNLFLCPFRFRRRGTKALTIASPGVLLHPLLASPNPDHTFAIVPSLNFLPLPHWNVLLSARTLSDRNIFISNQHQRVS